jgi:hypothetical protein
LAILKLLERGIEIKKGKIKHRRKTLTINTSGKGILNILLANRVSVFFVSPHNNLHLSPF